MLSFDMETIAKYEEQVKTFGRAAMGKYEEQAKKFGITRKHLMKGGVGLLCLVVLSSMFRLGGGPNDILYSQETLKTMGIVGSPDVTTGVVNGIAYNHCPGTDKHLILLHGASFDKDKWNTNGLMEGFCEFKTLSVTALDFPVSSDHEALKEMIVKLMKKYMLAPPVALVTPSASGKSMSDWIVNGNIKEVSQYISKWIPVACGSVSQATDRQLENLVGNLDILAVYGNEDRSGKTTSERLGTWANATVLELKGGHPVYLHSPNEFVRHVLEYIGVSD
eukprot:Nitzschia sp. Nitz4//scaffold100_size80364//26629//27462//NITZ4_005340-RA/size80364-processed-gene-0.31-mRNA-1//1//CDS//3329532082//1679//frame0